MFLEAWDSYSFREYTWPQIISWWIYGVLSPEGERQQQIEQHMLFLKRCALKGWSRCVFNGIHTCSISYANNRSTDSIYFDSMYVDSKSSSSPNLMKEKRSLACHFRTLFHFKDICQIFCWRTSRCAQSESCFHAHIWNLNLEGVKSSSPPFGYHTKKELKKNSKFFLNDLWDICSSEKKLRHNRRIFVRLICY